MNPATTIVLIDGALTVLEKLVPDLVQMFKNGEITTDQQKDVMRRIASLHQPEAFSGDEWKV